MQAGGGSRRHRQQLVGDLERAQAITSTDVQDAFLTVPRERFLPDVAAREGLPAVYRDDAIVTKKDARGLAISSSSQPRIMAQMLELLRVEPSHRVLEIGTGTGYNAALLAELAGPGGKVVSVELDPELADVARTRLAAGGHRVHVATRDGRRGWARSAPFDRLIATASIESMPRAWHEQLRPGGIAVVPIRIGGRQLAQVVAALRRTDDGFESVAAVCGGFMGLRLSPADPTPQGPQAQLVSGWMVEGSAHQTTIAGDAVRGMSVAARQRMLELLARRPRRRKLFAAPQPMCLGAYLAVVAPKRLVTWQARGQFGCGVALATGRGIAAVLQKGIGYGDDQTYLVALGDKHAERDLDRLLARFGATDGDNPLQPLRISARPDRDDLRFTFRWKRS